MINLDVFYNGKVNGNNLIVLLRLSYVYINTDQELFLISIANVLKK